MKFIKRNYYLLLSFLKRNKKDKLKMNIICFTITFLIVSATISAQESFNSKTKGTFLANGSILMHSTTHKINDNKTKLFSTEITPKVGVFIIDNLAAGLELNLKTSTRKFNDAIFGDFKSTSSSIAVAIFSRYYLNNGIFAEGMVGIGTFKTTNEGGILASRNENTSMFKYRAGLGYSLFLGKHVAIEPSINYSWENIDPESEPSDYKETIASIFLGIGITAYF